MSLDGIDAQTDRSLILARKVAQRLGHAKVSAPHLLVGLLNGIDRGQVQILAGFGVTTETLLRRMQDMPSGEPMTSEARMDHDVQRLVLSARRQAEAANRVLDAARLTRAVLSARHPVVEEVLEQARTSAGEILAALDVVPGPPAAELTRGHSQDLDALLDADAESDEQHVGLPAALESYGRDLVAEARAGRLGPVYGRTAELDRLQVLLALRSKSSPVLVGDPGVGKTAVVEALACALAADSCAPSLSGRPLVELDIAAMLAGARGRGEFESRLKKAVGAAATINAVLFIDEIHQIVGAGAARGAMDASNLLKEGLARGEISLIGATTADEFRKHIEPDAALARRLARVDVDAPNAEQTLEILRATRRTFAAHHGVQYTDDALRAAVRLTDQYVHGRSQPDKALDALDEAGAAAAIAIGRAHGPVGDLYQQRVAVRAELAVIVGSERYEDAGPVAERERALTSQILAEGAGDLAVVDQAHVRAVVARGTGALDLAPSSAGDLSTLEGDLCERVIGQDTAVAALTSAVRRRRVLGADRPLSLLFVGPTGVGKTELVTALADALAAGEMVRFDMSEFAEKHSVARLVGAPPGYVGHDEGGQLTEAIRRNPHAVVLLDEVEKAHPDTFDVLLQVFEDGRLTDGAGRAVAFKDATIIMTSNLGTQAAARPAAGFTSGAPADQRARARTLLHAAVTDHFRPEFINRIDQIVTFDALSPEALEGIAAKLLERPRAQLAAMGIDLRLTAEAVERMIAEGTDLVMGARPLRRSITRLLEDPLADALLSGALSSGMAADVDINDHGTLTVRPASSRGPAA